MVFEVEKSKFLLLGAKDTHIPNTKTSICGCNQKNIYENEKQPEIHWIPHYQPQLSLIYKKIEMDRWVVIMKQLVYLQINKSGAIYCHGRVGSQWWKGWKLVDMYKLMGFHIWWCTIHCTKITFFILLKEYYFKWFVYFYNYYIITYNIKIRF